ncbi:membrane protein of unknown function [Candidatus Saccharimonas aalborgensis]|uniref:TrbL/VirB6 plasmid conjugal transfer protein n=1 Tax=Candidatus Saccharimonas aalborgensis TaxID=1332188 RepID=R4PWX4_9BACT|nr:membrane protein of unknown function [Candidatus Saccharimonas aalborgensis]AGL62237.1 membrane protein of unknown function [Candidatus Saccharimonas aalborgensis]
MKRFGLFTVLGGVIITLFTPILTAPSLFALSYTSSSIDDKGKAWAYASYVYSCLAYASGKADSSVNDFVFFRSKDTQIGTFIDPGGERNCNDGSKMREALGFLGWTSGKEFICDIGVKRENNSDCRTGDGDWIIQGHERDFFNTIKQKVGANPFTPEGYVKYNYFIKSFKTACKVTNEATYDPATMEKGDTGYIIHAPSDDNTQLIEKFYRTELGRGKQIPVLAPISGSNSSEIDNEGGGQQNCESLSNLADKYANNYLTYVQNDPTAAQTCASKYKLSQAERTACEDGLKNKSDPAFCDTTYPPATKAAENTACKYGQKYASDPNAAGSTNGSKPTCVIKSIGWLVCPIMNFMATVNDGAQNYISMALVVNKEVTDQNGGTFTAWQQFRNYANAAFVLAFLIIIFSQISSIGITNYGIKKMLPKLIVAAILVNVSYYVCQLAVDISNMLGYSLSSLLSVTVTDPGAAAAASSSNKWLDTIGGILGMTGLGVAAIALLLSVSTPVVLAALLALALTVLILIGRQALIILLIVISPLAFVAYLLPNTENLFKKWYKLFSTLLLLFPIVALVFGASKLASTILSAAANGVSGTDANATATKTALGVGALGVSAIPLLIVLPLLKNALAAAGSVGAMLSKASSKANSRIGKKWNDTSMLGAMSQQRQRNQQLKRAQTLGGHGNGLGAKYYKGINRLTGKNYGGKLSAHGAGVAAEMEKKEVADEAIRMQKGWKEEQKLDEAQKVYEKAIAEGDTVRARAAQSILLAGGAKGMDNLHKGIVNAEGKKGFDKGSTTVQKLMSDLSAAGVKSRDAAVNSWSYSSGTLSSFDGAAGTYSGLTDAELAGQSEVQLKAAVSSGGLDAARAQGMMDNPNVWQNLNENKRNVLRGVAGTNGPSTPAGAAAAATGTSGSGAGQMPMPNQAPPPPPSGGGASPGPSAPPASGAAGGAAVGTPGVLNIPHASLGAKVAPANPAPAVPSSATSSATSSSSGSGGYSDIGDLVNVGADGKARHVAGQQSVTKDGSVGKVGGRFLSDYESEQIRAHADQIRDGLADRNTPGSGGTP